MLALLRFGKGPQVDGKTRVLFLCTKNSARSQMAEAFLNRYGGEHFEACSAGLTPGEIDPLTRRVMAELGYDLAGHWAKGVREYLGKAFFRYLIIPCAKTERDCPTIWPGVSERFFWPIEDPTVFEGTEEEKLTKFRKVRDQIGELAKAWVAEKTAPRLADQARGEPVPTFRSAGAGAFAFAGGPGE